MRWSEQELYQIFTARDATWDGRFLTGVVTTGIYCLPSCGARKPRAENVRFLPSEDKARAAGLRPCRRCRPDLFYARRDPDLERLEGLLAEASTAPAEFPDAASLAAASGFGVTKLAALTRRHYHATPLGLLVVMGRDTGSSMAAAVNNVILGNGSASVATGISNNVIIGASTATALTTGDNNVLIGNDAGDSITTPNSNVCIGGSAGAGIQTGGQNIAIGFTNMSALSSGNNNIALGNTSGNALTTGNDNIMLGRGSASGLTTGAENIAIGVNGGSAAITGNNNILLGSSSGTGITSGADNIFIGRSTGVLITTGINNIVIGRTASVANGSNQLIIDNAINAQPFISGDLSSNKLLVNSYDSSQYGFKLFNRDAGVSMQIHPAGPWEKRQV